MKILIFYTLFIFSLPLYAGGDLLSSQIIPQSTLEEILSSEDFGGSRPAWSIHLKDSGEKKEFGDFPEIDFPSWLTNLKEILAQFIRILVILVLCGFAVFIVLYQIRHSKKIFRDKGGTTYVNPFISAEDPELLFQRAEDFYRRFLYREAWAACLCGVFSAFSKYLDFNFPKDATEFDCLRQIQSTFSDMAAGFDDLVSNWVLLAYGGRSPAGGSFEKALEYGRSIEELGIRK